jgi:hypothetical protein
MRVDKSLYLLARHFVGMKIHCISRPEPCFNVIHVINSYLVLKVCLMVVFMLKSKLIELKLCNNTASADRPNRSLSKAKVLCAFKQKTDD